MKIILSGATGFVGRFLLQALHSRSECEAVCLTRDPEKATRALAPFPFARPLQWEPTAARADEALVEVIGTSDAVVHLAGEPLVGSRLTPRKKEEIKRSRVGTTRLLVDAIERASGRPQVFVSASAVGYYGDQPASRDLDESSPSGEDFLAEVCREWEGAAHPIRSLGVRLVVPRLGVVLGPDGGALEKMQIPARMCLGKRVGSGQQAVSWISAEDVARALLYCIDTTSLEGPVNFTAPHPLSNEELTRALAKQLDRPVFFSVPKFALRLAFGEGAEVLTAGQRALPRRLLEAGFQFHHATVQAALSWALASSSDNEHAPSENP